MVNQNTTPVHCAQVNDFASKTRMQKDKLDDVVHGMLGSSLGKGLTEAERVQMVEMVRYLLLYMYLYIYLFRNICIDRDR